MFGWFKKKGICPRDGTQCKFKIIAKHEVYQVTPSGRQIGDRPVAHTFVQQCEVCGVIKSTDV